MSTFAHWKQAFDQQVAAHAGIDCDLLVSTKKSANASAQDGSLDQAKISETTTLGIRVFKGDQRGAAQMKAQDPTQLGPLFEKALASAEYLKTSPAQKFYSSESSFFQSKDFTELCPLKDLGEYATWQEQSMRQKEGVAASPYNGVYHTQAAQAYMSSTGAFGETSSESYTKVISALVQNSKNGERGMNYDYQLTREKDFSKDQSFIDSTYEWASKQTQAASIESQNIPMIFERETLSELLSPYLGLFSALNVYKKKHPMAESLGKKVFSPLLSIQDTPQHPECFDPQFFDHEGLEMQELSLVKEGVFENMLTNYALSQELELPHTHRAQRSFAGDMGVSTSALSIAAGKTSESDLFSGRVFLVRELQGVYTGVRFGSGDFSIGAAGEIIENGKCVQVVKGITIAGNFYKALADIEAVGSEVKADRSRSFFSPLIRFAPLSLSS